MSYHKLKDAISRDQQRKQQAEKERSMVLQAARILGVLGFTFVVPIVAGAYLGQWLDSLSEGYSVRWTIGFILIGLIVGGVNAWLLLREK